ncbi:MaoC family dehydratase [Azospirillum agricola]|uniref:MaoC family dehydratase n=1 Tax=Azospirillum agricola TaxID=1720247 RepID=UPI000A0F2941|nr:MaoC/PaaZ C-terminal domain-containing protein [Azospirillum agricola]SMH46984.1 Acyl dehydratase [Azospirillum lipoferum]
MTNPIHLDEIEPGARALSTRVTVTEAHIVWFAGLTGDFNPLHMDAEAAKANGFGRTIAHGMLTHSMSTGLRSAIDDWAILAFLETRRRFVGPVFAGDTIQYEAEVLEVRPSASKPDRGIVRVGITVRNQSGGTVQEGEDVFSIGRQVTGRVTA